MHGDHEVRLVESLYEDGDGAQVPPMISEPVYITSCQARDGSLVSRETTMAICLLDGCVCFRKSEDGMRPAVSAVQGDGRTNSFLSSCTERSVEGDDDGGAAPMPRPSAIAIF